MRTVNCRITVYFDDPFWVGLYEREDGGWYEVSRIVFGAEPRDQEVYAFLLRAWRGLRFSPPMPSAQVERRQVSAKRRQREARRAVSTEGAGTKAQQALAAQREQGRQARRIRTRAEKEREAAERFARHQQKRKEKHRGR